VNDAGQATAVTVVHASTPYAARPVEVVERKGNGHPDTLADALGEHLSLEYSRFTLREYGAILHHQFDKVGIMGGAAEVAFGGGSLTRPIRVLLNGRASGSFAGTPIPVEELLVEWCREFFARRFPMLDTLVDLRILYEVSSGPSPGVVVGGNGRRSRWFHPESFEDLPELVIRRGNDTSLGCAFAPYSPLEALVLRVERHLNSVEFKERHNWIGSDIKIMAVRTGDAVRLTLAVPQLCEFVRSLDDYRTNMSVVYEEVLGASRTVEGFELDISLNTRDDYSGPELYLTVTGSSIETGDEGFVGRGNRFGGVIAPFRPFTMEGISGKNPVYHAGKMYCVAAAEIAERLTTETDAPADVLIVGQTGRALETPWLVGVVTENKELEESVVREVVKEELDHFPLFTERLLRSQYRLH
jgi:S-adenosylmethionine synthetase